MKPEELIPGQRYRLREGLSPSIEAGLKGTDRIVELRMVELASSIPSCNEYTFMWRNYTDCIATVRAEDVECWIPRIGEEALFWDEHYGRPRKEKMVGYVCDRSSPFYTNYNSRRYCKPLPKKVEKPQPDRNQPFEPAELEAMQEEAMLESIESHKPEITVVPDPEQPRYAALKKRLIRLERFMADINDLHKNTGGTIYEQLRCLKNEQETAGANMLVLLQELTVRMEALEAKDEDLSSWQKRFGDAVDRLTARMNLITEKVDMFSRPIYAINPNPFYVNTPDSDKAV
jgi:hypothetical protein